MSAEDDMPVVGASILVKGTSNGTITDIDGKFILKVNKGDKLEISYIGMKSQTVAAQNNMKVVLESDTEVLDEVVVTGMQRMGYLLPLFECEIETMMLKTKYYRKKDYFIIIIVYLVMSLPYINKRQIIIY